MLTVLGGGEPLRYLWNTIADAYLDEMEVSAQARRYLSRVARAQVLDEASLISLLEPLFRWVGPKQRTLRYGSGQALVPGSARPGGLSGAGHLAGQPRAAVR